MGSAEQEPKPAPKGRWTLILLGVFSVLVIVGIVLMSLVHTGLLWLNMPSLRKYPVQGLDVSAHQGEIFWKYIDSQRWRFVYIKATEGGDFKDPRFQQNWEASRQSGLKRGAYHFFTFCKSGTEQAQNFMDSVPVEAQTLPPAVDLEFGGNCSQRPEKAVLLQELQDFVQDLEEHYGQKPLFYITRSFAQTYLDPEALAEYKLEHRLWYRDVLSEPGPVLNRPWTFWQYNGRGRVEGIQGPVDLNVFASSPESFEQLLSPAEPPVQP